jgi:uncharacterized protein (DUF1330 family)
MSTTIDKKLIRNSTETTMNKLIAPVVIGFTIALAAATGQAQEAKPSLGASATAAKAPAHAYLIGNYVIRDQAMFQRYLDAANGLAPRYAVKVIVFDTNTHKLEGNAQAVTVIAEFPSMAEAERFYFSAEYTEAKKLRIGSTEGSVVLAQGLIPAET